MFWVFTSILRQVSVESLYQYADIKMIGLQLLEYFESFCLIG